MKHDIFVSYSRRDSEIVLPIVDRLKDAGYSCWMDVTGIESGDAFKHVIVNAIKHSGVVLFFSSAAANESRYTVKEINVAVELCKPIIPFKLDDAPYADSIMFDLSGLDFVTYSGDEGIARLQKTLKARLRQKECDGQSLESLNSLGQLQIEYARDTGHKLVQFDSGILFDVVDRASRFNDVHCEETTCAYGCAAGLDIHDLNEMRRLQELDESIRRENHISDRYRVDSLLKYGGRTVVYKVRDKKNGENRILKVALVDTHPSPSDHPMSLWKRMFRFGRTKGDVQDGFGTIEQVYRKLMDMAPKHPNLVAIRRFEPDRKNGRYYVVEDFVDGASLADVVRVLHSRLWGMSVPSTAIKDVATSGFSILKGIADGLDWLHKNGIVHCDVKPDNIMVDRKGIAMITDFGEARMLSKLKSFQVGKLDVLGITPTYMAPEQWARTALDSHTDQYSLGVIAYQMIFQRLPFDSKNFSELRDAVMFEKVPVSPICPKSISDCLAKALAKKKSDRFTSCGEFVSALGSAIHGWLS